MSTESELQEQIDQAINQAKDGLSQIVSMQGQLADMADEEGNSDEAEDYRNKAAQNADMMGEMDGLR
jgi:hypothetical protein